MPNLFRLIKILTNTRPENNQHKNHSELGRPIESDDDDIINLKMQKKNRKKISRKSYQNFMVNSSSLDMCKVEIKFIFPFVSLGLFFLVYFPFKCNLFTRMEKLISLQTKKKCCYLFFSYFLCCMTKTKTKTKQKKEKYMSTILYPFCEFF